VNGLLTRRAFGGGWAGKSICEAAVQKKSVAANGSPFGKVVGEAEKERRMNFGMEKWERWSASIGRLAIPDRSDRHRTILRDGGKWVGRGEGNCSKKREIMEEMRRECEGNGIVE
jgi:hypothetical protein